MFLHNKYTAAYYAIISIYRADQGERHHIIPKSLGGSNSKSNIVTVSPRVHFILHKLLCRMVANEAHRRSMYFALFQMMNRKVCKFTSRDYNIARLKVKEQMKSNNPMYDPNIVAKLPQKRPGQSAVASKRNEIYWSSRARPIREFNCPVCDTPIITRVPTKTTCSRACSSIVQHRK